MQAIRHTERTGTVVGTPGASPISNEELLTLKCEILLPAALENVITLKNADQIKANIVAEAANGPITSAADEVLARQGIFLLPDIMAIAGGVTESYIEWVQDLQCFFWQEREVNAKLEFVIKRAFKDVYAAWQKYKTHMRTAAYILAGGRVADATLVRGLLP